MCRVQAQKAKRTRHAGYGEGGKSEDRAAPDRYLKEVEPAGVRLTGTNRRGTGARRGVESDLHRAAAAPGIPPRRRRRETQHK